jgi:hypothetical protein
MEYAESQNVHAHQPLWIRVGLLLLRLLIIWIRSISVEIVSTIYQPEFDIKIIQPIEKINSIIIVLLFPILSPPYLTDSFTFKNEVSY